MSVNQNQQLFSAQTSNGNSPLASWPGGRGVFAVFGTFGGATVKLQWSPDADSGTASPTWLDVDQNGDTYVTKSAAGHGGFELPPCQIRANLASASGTTSLTATVGGLHV